MPALDRVKDPGEAEADDGQVPTCDSSDAIQRVNLGELFNRASSVANRVFHIRTLMGANSDSCASMFDISDNGL